MPRSWQDLTNLTQGAPLTVERVRLAEPGIAIEGEFDLPPLAQLTMEDQVFVMAFVREHGSIKQMEALFGVSYPTIKNRLNGIAERFEALDSARSAAKAEPTVGEVATNRTEILDLLDRGEISAKEAARRLRD